MQIYRSLISLLLVAGLAACQHPRAALVPDLELPASWTTENMAQTENEGVSPVTDGWLATLGLAEVEQLARAAVLQNHTLAQQAAQVEAARQRVIVAGADRWPVLSVSSTGRRARNGASAAITETFDINVFSSFEIDLWGRLSALQREARLNLAAQQMRYQVSERALVAQTVSAAFDLITAQKLLTLFEQRLANLSQSLDVIERGYRSGLNSALDVYLAQTTVEQERANIANQQQSRFESSTRLQSLLGSFPDAKLKLVADLPAYPQSLRVGLPSEVAKRRSDVAQAWLELLAADAALAAAHRNRFPSLNFSASLSDVDDSVSTLLDGGQLAFSVAASLAQPLLQGGRLAALEEQAKALVEQAERRYLQVLFDAFAEIENELSKGRTLQQRLTALSKANDNAQVALRLAFDQYQRGLVSYTTVLEAQRRAFDTQTTVVQLENQLARSAVALNLAVGSAY